jgi:hypothetical protein
MDCTNSEEKLMASQRKRELMDCTNSEEKLNDCTKSEKGTNGSNK